MQLPALAPSPRDAQFDLVGQHLAKARAITRQGRLIGGVLLLPALAWLSFAPLASAVVASGHVKVDLNRSIVQHAEGGTVRAVYVRDGQKVRAGDPLIELGDVSVNADKTRLMQRLLAERAGLARLETEQAGGKTLAYPPELIAAGRDDPVVREHMDKELALFTARLHALDSQAGLLVKQRAKIQQEIASLQAQIGNARDSIQAQSRELALNTSLAKQGLVSETQVMQLEASIADYRGKMAERSAEMARADQRIGDIELRLSQSRNDYRQQASDQLKVANVRVQEIEQELRKATDASKRQVLSASVDGEVIGLRITSPGGVIAPREPVGEIVPANPRLVVEAQIRTEDINRVQRGQGADLRFTAFKYRTTQMVKGSVSYVGADRQVDKDNGMAYYVVTIDVPPDAIERAVTGEAHARLQAGMPAEVYLHGEERTPLQYLMEPITQVMRRAGRER
ncbi:type I secretion membrane fusion protein, HlyD family [Leptothrix cholodnii SP-6]|uniref:Membrane fusion protein (MFP) family protein n=1 Tax=Leptothrix cholodnii (strain ATCC 51168 / LMG 8142 / SP-6) TaxID=395495 RepID=B1XZ08_LEPCP|nr:HlyD family type I secretion periplasmic adaptor subunit [Leptothrix cholodnii]ACB34027.1 type I secretion membrane fusion protein, HlyD family [Leptothrix cholodnii SP-6]